jgi:rubrerythrin
MIKDSIFSQIFLNARQLKKCFTSKNWQIESFLKGEVEMVAASSVKKIHDVTEMLKVATAMEESSANDYNKFAQECASNADSVTKQLFESLVVDEERHYNQYDTEMDNMKKFGANYLALQSIERSKGQNATAVVGTGGHRINLENLKSYF